MRILSKLVVGAAVAATAVAMAAPSALADPPSEASKKADSAAKRERECFTGDLRGETRARPR